MSVALYEHGGFPRGKQDYAVGECGNVFPIPSTTTRVNTFLSGREGLSPGVSGHLVHAFSLCRIGVAGFAGDATGSHLSCFTILH